jgi:two-component system, OmpR family, sensor histidine kinase KdpD
MNCDARPDPDAVLARVIREEAAQSGRGTLRIYLGAFAGVGKTYTMLSEARRRTNYGEDVVVGFVETHGRKQTEAILEGLEVVPRRRIEYRGVAVEEMDVDAILHRRPAVCLVDELAHTNAPGSEREKRYEDVEVLLDAGINVVSTLNVQHLESLNDTVHSLTGVRVRETIPDSVIDEADELILIDLSPEGARARMQHGHIYPADQARAALESFFRPENLAALREIALRRTAQEVDEQLDTYMRELTHQRADVDEHVLAFVDGSPSSPVLIRRAWRIAQGLRSDLLVAYIRREMSESEQRELARTLELAEDLNAHVVPLEGDNAGQALTAFIKAEHVNHVVLTHRKRGLLARVAGRSLADQLMADLPDVELHLTASGD